MTYRRPFPHPSGAQVPALFPRGAAQTWPSSWTATADGPSPAAWTPPATRRGGRAARRRRRAIELGIPHLSAYAFSTENRKRSPTRCALPRVFNRDVIRRRRPAHDWGVRMRWVGQGPAAVALGHPRVPGRRGTDPAQHRPHAVLLRQLRRARRDRRRHVARLAADVASGWLAAGSTSRRSSAISPSRRCRPDLPSAPPVSSARRTSCLLAAAYAERVCPDTLWPGMSTAGTCGGPSRPMSVAMALWRAVDQPQESSQTQLPAPGPRTSPVTAEPPERGGLGRPGSSLRPHRGANRPRQSLLTRGRRRGCPAREWFESVRGAVPWAGLACAAAGLYRSGPGGGWLHTAVASVEPLSAWLAVVASVCLQGCFLVAGVLLGRPVGVALPRMAHRLSALRPVTPTTPDEVPASRRGGGPLPVAVSALAGLSRRRPPLVPRTRPPSGVAPA